MSDHRAHRSLSLHLHPLRFQVVAALEERLGGADALRNVCGLPISTYFSGVKLRWLLDHVPAVSAAAGIRMLFLFVSFMPNVALPNRSQIPQYRCAFHRTPHISIRALIHGRTATSNLRQSVVTLLLVQWTVGWCGR